MLEIGSLCDLRVVEKSKNVNRETPNADGNCNFVTFISSD